ncbi:MAG: hypothetical protein AAFX06_28135 [Planctomycetota bacterium]
MSETDPEQRLRQAFEAVNPEHTFARVVEAIRNTLGDHDQHRRELEAMAELAEEQDVREYRERLARYGLELPEDATGLDRIIPFYNAAEAFGMDDVWDRPMGEVFEFLDDKFQGIELARQMKRKAEERADEKIDSTEVRHGKDYRSVRWGDTIFEFTPNQAAVVAILFKAFDNGTPAVGEVTLLEDSGVDSSRLRDVFRKHPAFSTMIVPGQTKGTFQIVDPEQELPR